MNCRHGIDTTTDYCANCAVDDYNLQLREANEEIDRLRAELREAKLSSELGWHEQKQCEHACDQRDKELERLRAELERLNKWQENYANECQQKEDALRAELEQTKKQISKYKSWVANQKEVDAIFGQFPNGMTMRDAKEVLAKENLAGMEDMAKFSFEIGHAGSRHYVYERSMARIEEKKNAQS